MKLSYIFDLLLVPLTVYRICFVGLNPLKKYECTFESAAQNLYLHVYFESTISNILEVVTRIPTNCDWRVVVAVHIQQIQVMLRIFTSQFRNAFYTVAAAK